MKLSHIAPVEDGIEMWTRRYLLKIIQVGASTSIHEGKLIGTIAIRDLIIVL